MINAYAAMQAKADLESFEYDPGPLGDADVEISVDYCGICQSDISMIDNEWGRSQYPLVPGHEIIGTVAQVGPNVATLAPGDVVGLGWHAAYCMTCDTCMSGDHNLCPTVQPTIVGRHGGFADKVRASEASVVKLPPGIDKASAGPLFCGGITVFNPLVQYNVQSTDSVGVVGIGGLGHLALKFLAAWGCHVTAFTSSEAKTPEALAMGAHSTINSTDPADIRQHASEFDLIISTVDAALDWTVYVNTLKPRGRLHFVGIPTQPLELSVISLLRQQKAVSASPVGSPATIAQMLEFAVRHNITPQVEEYGISQVNDALARLRSGKARYRVVLNMAA
ncbi:MAG: NADPH-dependent aldehyde reductase Ahr [Halioglobus sp.]